MPRYDDLDDSQKILVDRIANYNVILENCAAYLRQYDMALITPIWEQQQAIYMGDPAKYATVIVGSCDTEGRIRFREKCQALLFPLGSKRPLEDYIMMYFAAMAGLQLASQEAFENHPNLSPVGHRRALKILENQSYQAPKNKLDYNGDGAYQKPAKLVDQKIRCRDNSSGEIIEYVVVDYIKSLIRGDFFVLEDRQGRRHDVTPEELDEIRVDDDSIELQLTNVLHYKL